MIPLALSLDWNIGELRAALSPELPGVEIEVLASTGSSNSALIEDLRRAEAVEDDAALAMRRRSVESRAFHRRAPDRAPRLLVAEHQTAGRGRQGRPWHAAIGASLTFSLAVPMRRVDLSGLSLAVGVALVDALDPNAVAGLGLKWPNDVWKTDPAAPVGARKLGGILIETLTALGQRWVVIGVGLNVKVVDAPGATTGVAALSELDAAASAPNVLVAIAGPLAAAIASFERDGFAAFAEGFAARDLLRDAPVTTTSPDAPEGIARGVDATGALRVDTPQGVRMLHGGEVSVRPRRAGMDAPEGHGHAPC